MAKHERTHLRITLSLHLRRWHQMVAYYFFLVLFVFPFEAVLGNDAFVTIGQFTIVLEPVTKQMEFDNHQNLLWTVEMLIRKNLEEQYHDNFITVGITGLAVIPSDDESETVRFLGGAAKFDGDASALIPSEDDLVGIVRTALKEDTLIQDLGGYFPGLTSAVFHLPGEIEPYSENGDDSESESDRDGASDERGSGDENGNQNGNENGNQNGDENGSQNGDENGSQNGDENGSQNGDENGNQNGNENGTGFDDESSSGNSENFDSTARDIGNSQNPDNGDTNGGINSSQQGNQQVSSNSQGKSLQRGETTQVATPFAGDTPPRSQTNSLEAQQPVQDFNSSDNSIVMPAGLAVGGTFILLGLLLFARRRKQRMSYWREPDDVKGEAVAASLDLETEPRKEVIQPVRATITGWDDSSSGISNSPARMSRMWGGVGAASSVVDSPESSRTPQGSSSESDTYQDRDDGNTTVETDGELALNSVESFEHQKRLVDVLKKEMITSNVELYPYTQETHIDSSEPCALSPSDLSARALDRRLDLQTGSWSPGDISMDSEGSITPTKSPPSASQLSRPSLRQTQGTIQGGTKNGRWNLQRLRTPPETMLSRSFSSRENES